MGVESAHIETVSDWFGRSGATEASIGGFLFVLLASVALGVFVQGIRAVCLEGLIKKWGGLQRPPHDFSKIATPEKLAAFQVIVEDRYRYYQFYSNSLVALVIAFVTTALAKRHSSAELLVGLVIVLLVVVVLWFSARNSLGGYYDEVRDLISGERGTDD